MSGVTARTDISRAQVEAAVVRACEIEMEQQQAFEAAG